MVLLAGLLAVWRPWSDVPELVEPQDEPRSTAQQAALSAAQILSPRLPLAPARERPSVWVMPFAAEPGSESATHLGAGIAESVIEQLSRVSGLAVLGRDTAFHSARAQAAGSVAPAAWARAE